MIVCDGWISVLSISGQIYRRIDLPHPLAAALDIREAKRKQVKFALFILYHSKAIVHIGNVGPCIHKDFP